MYSSSGALSDVQSLRCGRDPKPWTTTSPERAQTQVRGVGKILLCRSASNMVLAVMTEPVIFGRDRVADFDNFESCRKATGANTVPKCRTASVPLVLPFSTAFGSSVDYNMLRTASIYTIIYLNRQARLPQLWHIWRGLKIQR